MSSKEAVVIPVSGAYNDMSDWWRPTIMGPKRTVFSMTGSLFAPLRHAFNQRGMPVEKTIILPRYGIQDPNVTYAVVEKEIDRRLDRNPGRRALLIAHSLGGLIVAPMIAKDAYQDRIIGGITLGSPHDGANEEYFKRGEIFLKCLENMNLVDSKGFDDNIEDFKLNTLSIARANAAQLGGRLHVAGSPHDEVVPIQSSTHAIPGASRYVLSPTSLDEPLPGVNHVEVSRGLAHHELLTARDAIRFVLDTSFDMLTTSIDQIPHLNYS